ncbi:hypothetical protein CKN73_13490 [Carnobacterium divergens]|uniref:hypothetical protein n=1 Tax=Carnobacterium divergens TaxID=2748 RepID=UPI001072D2CF|nr:hypothetical protein [Carnobacterium divergens]TFJ36743.1 hypothetical protein CKN77_13445 [Carnobacterium divergens]TFJ46524.1 hypothetical protein CKN73_13490 [Carnobacterium divergens]TFJ51375.1 hypothetical protein CKN83_13215 [Carnobacterium divergens]TFJ59534.1 hypothetical protein CKN89_07655 [Carnobacterium divergens]TFJ68406.1 hypothetical protein CKN78_13470 [Carnobacterium divergens]
MTKFELYERMLQEISEEENYLSERGYTEVEYQKFKKLFKKNLEDTANLFNEWINTKQNM